MSMKMTVSARVVQKFIKEGSKPDGTPTKYYNLKIANVETFDSQLVGCSESVYNSVEEGEDVTFDGSFGGLGSNRWYSIDGLHLGK